MFGTNGEPRVSNIPCAYDCNNLSEANLEDLLVTPPRVISLEKKLSHIIPGIGLMSAAAISYYGGP